MITFEEIKTFPTSSGVYLMKNEKEEVIYVGKANNIRSRIKQYFAGLDQREIIPHLIKEVASIDFIVVTSEKEALLLENNLIKKHWPKYNAHLKDDKSYFSLMINHTHPWPMLRIVRFKGKAPSGALYFGPYTKALAVRETLELLRSLFPLRQCSDRELVKRKRPCILFDLKRCIAPCVAKCTKEEYDKVVARTIDFLRGHDKTLLKSLHDEMLRLSDNQEFEKAGLLLKKIRDIEYMLEKQYVEKAGMIDIDVLGVHRHLGNTALSQLIFREGKLIGSHDFFFPHNAQDDDALITSFILQHYEKESFLPHKILTPLQLKEHKILSHLLSEGSPHKVEIFFPKKGDKLTLLKMAEKNAQAHFEKRQKKENLQERILMSLEEELHLTNFPEKIECFDTSHTSGDEPVSSMIVFLHGEKASSLYRKYKLKKTAPGDDYGALEEVLKRRYRRAKEEDNLPDLLVIDGGKGHLHLALKVLSELDVSTVDVIALTKEEGKHTKGLTQERIFLAGRDEPLMLPPTSPLLLFLQKIRDEAHRTAILFQRKRRSKKTLKSQLDEIPGIGPIKKKRLLIHFGSMELLKKASEEELRKIPGITKKDIINLRKFLEESPSP